VPDFCSNDGVVRGICLIIQDRQDRQDRPAFAKHMSLPATLQFDEALFVAPRPWPPRTFSVRAMDQ